MVKILLKRSADDAGVRVEASEKVMMFPNIIKYEGGVYVREVEGGDAWKTCGSCRHMNDGVVRVSTSTSGFCRVDTKVAHYDWTCRNGGWSPEGLVYREVKQLTVVAGSPHEAETHPEKSDQHSQADPEISSGESTQVVERRLLPSGKSAYAAAALFFAASVLCTLWILLHSSR